MTINILQGVRRAKCNILAEHVDIDDISEWVFAREFLKNNGREQMSEAHRFSEKGKKKNARRSADYTRTGDHKIRMSAG